MDLEYSDIPGNKQSSNNIGIGFLNDFRRTNVGLSRAKFGCFIVGHYEILKNNNYWNKPIQYCMSKNSFFSVDNENANTSIKNILI